MVFRLKTKGPVQRLYSFMKNPLFSNFRKQGISFTFAEFSVRLLALEGEKGRDSRALDRGSENSLVRRARAAHSAGDDFTAFRYEFLQTVDIFIVDFGNFFLAESADFFTGHFFIALPYGSLFFHDFYSLCYFFP
jgi:hypothetical protein